MKVLRDNSYHIIKYDYDDDEYICIEFSYIIDKGFYLRDSSSMLCISLSG